MWKKLVVACLAALLTAPAMAANLTGAWKLTAEGKVALLLDVERASSGDWRALIRKPDGMSIDDGTSISEMGTSASERTLTDHAGTPDKLVLRFDPERPGEDQVRMILSALDDNHAQLAIAFAGQQSQPMALRRADPQDSIDARWEARSYALDAAWPDNPEIQRLFAEDQADRADPAKIDWSVVTPRDEARRSKTMALLSAGKLRSGADFHAAAFIFQHGDKPEDFLLAHSLAIAAVARGESRSAWIAAATLDRYLQKVGQPQIYGTQFNAPKGGKATQGDYNRTLVPDSLRGALGVPSLAEQEAQRRMWEERMNAKP